MQTSRPTARLHSIRAHAKAVAALALLGLASSAWCADLTVQVRNISVDTGTLMVALFTETDEFPKTFRFGQQVAAARKAADGSLRVVFADLAPGRYAISAYHDLNSNGKLDTNLVGLPTEPLGFSNNAKVSFGPPKFKDAAFDVGAQGASAVVSLD